MFLFKHLVTLWIMLCYLPGTVHCLTLTSEDSPQAWIHACATDVTQSPCQQPCGDSPQDTVPPSCPCSDLTQTFYGQDQGTSSNVPSFIPLDHDIALWEFRSLPFRGEYANLVLFQDLQGTERCAWHNRRLPSETNVTWAFAHRAALPVRFPETIA